MINWFKRKKKAVASPIRSDSYTYSSSDYDYTPLVLTSVMQSNAALSAPDFAVSGGGLFGGSGASGSWDSSSSDSCSSSSSDSGSSSSDSGSGSCD